MSDASQESTRASSKGGGRSRVDTVMYALSIASLGALAATVAFMGWSRADQHRQDDKAYVQAVEDMYGGVDVDTLIGEGQVRLTRGSAVDGRDYCFGPEEYRVVADSVESPDTLRCFDRESYREIVELVEDEGGEIIGRAMEQDALAVVFEDGGPFGRSCIIPKPHDTELTCAH